MKNTLLLSVFGSVTLLLSACVTHINSNVVQNPPPKEAFSNFIHVELLPVKLLPPYAGQEANEKALLKIQENVSARMNPLLAKWNSAEGGGKPARTLVIEPVIPEMKFLNATTRVWTGAFSGSSAVILRAKIVDQQTGEVVAEPEFYARAAAMGGAWSFGASDNAMLVRIANRLSDYLEANYAKAVGGPSGAEPN